MTKYLSFFRIRFAAALQYRAAAIAGVATQFAWGFMEIILFTAFYEANPAAFPMDRQALSSYVWLQQATLAMFMMWKCDTSIFTAIRDGSVAMELCRPCDIYTMWFTKNLASRLADTLLRCVPVIAVSAILPAPYGMALPADAMAALLFVISAILGVFVVLSALMLLYISTFFTISHTGVRMFVATIAEFASGGVVPLPFMPDGVQRVLAILPFASMQSTPFLIWGGTLAGRDALIAMGLQAFWVVVLTVLGRLWMRAALKKVVAQGG
ncbi:MAG: ABC transporter permease [Ruminococcaceae bacterium]|nr:ABC transporter permease [Oscillospiraceae bacterium]